MIERETVARKRQALNAMFKTQPPDCAGLIGAGEMERMLDAALATLSPGGDVGEDELARAICKETCAQMGELACWEDVNGGDAIWPNPACDGCAAATAVTRPLLTAAEARIAALTAERDALSDKLELARALTDGAYRRARQAERERDRLAEALNIADEYLGKLQTPASEPLNSVNAGTTKAMRGQWTAEVRNQAREVWAIIGNVRDHGMTVAEARAASGGGA